MYISNMDDIMIDKSINLATIEEIKQILKSSVEVVETIKNKLLEIENINNRAMSFLDSILEMAEDDPDGTVEEEALSDTAVVFENRKDRVLRPQIVEQRETKKKPKKDIKKETPINLPVEINDDDWPMAIPESAIVKIDSQKWARANTILTKFDAMQGPVLDFGCGEGHTTVAIHDQGIKTIGFDIKENSLWDKLDSDKSGLFTSNWDNIVDHGPYKSVLLHDVIDHVERDSIAEIIEKIYDVTAVNGRIYVMAHPFSSRHGGHLYEHVNKAYYHMLLTDEEMSEYKDIPPNQRIIKPQGQYQKYFTSKFAIVSKKVVPQSLEPWVVKNVVPLVFEKWYSELDLERVEKIMSISGIYYTLKRLPNPV